MKSDAGLAARRIGWVGKGEIVFVKGDRKTVDGYDWYPVATLAYPAGWVASGTRDEAFLTGIGHEAFVSWCGKVTDSDPVKVGGTVMPKSAFDRIGIGVLRLAEAMAVRACMSVIRDGPGIAVRMDVFVTACGAPSWDGRVIRLAPSLHSGVVSEMRVRTTIVVPNAVLTEAATIGPEGRTNRQNVAILASRADDPFVCVHARVTRARRESATAGS